MQLLSEVSALGVDRMFIRLRQIILDSITAWEATRSPADKLGQVSR